MDCGGFRTSSWTSTDRCCPRFTPIKKIHEPLQRSSDLLIACVGCGRRPGRNNTERQMLPRAQTEQRCDHDTIVRWSRPRLLFLCLLLTFHANSCSLVGDGVQFAIHFQMSPRLLLHCFAFAYSRFSHSRNAVLSFITCRYESSVASVLSRSSLRGAIQCIASTAGIPRTRSARSSASSRASSAMYSARAR